MDSLEKEQLFKLIERSWSQFHSKDDRVRQGHLQVDIRKEYCGDLRNDLLWLEGENRIVIPDEYLLRLQFVDMSTWQQDDVNALLSAKVVPPCADKPC